VVIRQSRPRDARVRVYTDGGGCRRVHLDGYLDGDTTRKQCRKGEVVYDWCQAQEPQRQAPPRRYAPTARMVAALTQIAYGMLLVTQRSFACTLSPQSQPQLQSQLQSQTSLSTFRRLERIERERMQPDERRLEQSQDRRVWHEDLRERLNQWKNVCMMCYSRGENSRHTINRCLLEDSIAAKREQAHV
jgi:hypothetical protein